MPETAIQQAIEFLELGQARDVKDIARGLIERHPQHTAAHVLMAKALELEEDWGGAFSAWKRAEFWLPNSPSVRSGLGRSLSAMSAGSFPSIPGLQPQESPSTPEPQVADTQRSLDPAVAGATHAIPDIDLTDMDLTGIDLEAHIEPAVLSQPDSGQAGETQAVDGPSTHGVTYEPLGNFTGADDNGDQIDELNELINELESARILPETGDRSPEPENESGSQDDEVVSETLARIYATQEQFGEAARVYTKLAERQPERAEEFLELAQLMHERSGK